MRKKSLFKILTGPFLVGIILAFPNGAVATHCGQDTVFGGGNGHDVPTPFQLTKFELADGETYVLSGFVVKMPSLTEDSLTDRLYFQINLENYPWIANRKRVDSPFYQLEGSVPPWALRTREMVKLICKAHARIYLSGGVPAYTITLEPLFIEANDT